MSKRIKLFEELFSGDPLVEEVEAVLNEVTEILVKDLSKEIESGIVGDSTRLVKNLLANIKVELDREIQEKRIRGQKRLVSDSLGEVISKLT